MYIIILIMNKKAQWILTEKQLKMLEDHRSEHYKNMQYQAVDHALFSRGYCRQLVHLIRQRKKKSSIDMPFKFQKLVYYAVALFKRYYLVNSYICQELSYLQSMICCVYLSFKFNQYDDSFMLDIAQKWKRSLFSTHKIKLPHYGDQNYTQAELRFLSGIKFQTALSKVVTPIEAIYHRLMRGKNEPQQLKGHAQVNPDTIGLKQTIQQCLDLCYAHPSLMFLFEGPIIGFAVMVHALRIKKVPQEKLGEQFQPILKNNMEKIQQIIMMMEEEREKFGVEEKELYEIQKKKISNIQYFKKPVHKSQQTPRLQPYQESFLQKEEEE